MFSSTATSPCIGIETGIALVGTVFSGSDEMSILILFVLVCLVFLINTDVNVKNNLFLYAPKIVDYCYNR